MVEKLCEKYLDQVLYCRKLQYLSKYDKDLEEVLIKYQNDKKDMEQDLYNILKKRFES